MLMKKEKEELPQAKIFEFPKNRIVREVPQGSVKEAADRREREQIEDITNGVIQSVFDACVSFGIDVDSEVFQKDFSYLANVTQATVFRNFKVEHDLHSMLDETIKVLSEEEFDELKKKNAEENLELEEEEGDD